MSKKSEQNTFHKIMVEGNSVLEAGIVEGVLKLRLIVSESVHMRNVYIGEIRNICDHEKLKQWFDTLEETLEFFKDPKNVKLNLEDKSVALIGQTGKKINEIVKVLLQKLIEEDYAQPILLDDVIDRCNQKDDLSNYEIKQNFEILAKEIIQLKQMHKKEKFQSLKEDMIVFMNQQTQKSNKKVENVENTILTKISLLRKQISEVDTKYETEFNSFRKEIETKNICYEKDYSQFKKMIEVNAQRIQTILPKTIQKLGQDNSQEISADSQNKINSFLIQLFEQKEKQTKQYKQKSYKQLNVGKQFTFDGKTIIKINNGWKDITFFQQVSFKNQIQFTIKIIKTKSKQIRFGICMIRQYFIDKDFICYSASNGKIYPGSIKEGDGVKVGETVKVVVNRNDKTIKWIVNGITRASLTNDMLGDKERLFYPFMEMKDQQDTVEFELK